MDAYKGYTSIRGVSSPIRSSSQLCSHLVSCKLSAACGRPLFTVSLLAASRKREETEECLEQEIRISSAQAVFRNGRKRLWHRSRILFLRHKRIHSAFDGF